MSSRVVVAVGTVKGLFVYESDESRTDWKLGEPQQAGWEVSTLLLDPKPGAGLRMLAGTVHYAYGATVRETLDGGNTWQQLDGRPAYAEGSGFKLNRIWQLQRAHASRPKTLYAGVDEAGLFVSHDDATTWSEVSSLTRDPTRAQWYPGAGGLCLHSIINDYANPDRLWIAISAVGVFRSVDAGRSWHLCNTGLTPIEGAPAENLPLCCIHRIVQHPTEPDTLFMQYHGGVFVSRDGASTWQRIEHGLPGNFGFPMSITRAGTLFIAPLDAETQRVFKDGRFAIYRSTDEGQSWQAQTRGFPTDPTYTGVLRDAMTTDGLADNEGIYVGTTGGQVWCTTDNGDSWSRLPGTLPRVLSVRAVAVEN